MKRALKDKNIKQQTFASVLDADWLEASVEGRGIDDVRVEVAVVLPVDEERHDDRDNQAHDHRYDYAHVQSYIICAGRHWGRREGIGKDGQKTRKTERKMAFRYLMSSHFHFNMWQL